MKEDLDSKTLEKKVKQSLLNNPELFNYLGNLGNNRTIFEKVVLYNKLRCDALIFTEKRGIIGVEIKTQYDNLNRLNRQLNNYKKVCNYVFVYCHDSHLEKVKQLLKEHSYGDYVGIISYSTFKGDVIPGLYRKAYSSPVYSIRDAVKMLWKSEIRDILRVYTTKQAQLAAKDNNYTYASIYPNALQMSSYGYTGIASTKLNKNQLISNYIGMFGKKIGTKILAQRFIYGDVDPTKYLKLYHFNDDINKPVEIGIM